MASEEKKHLESVLQPFLKKSGFRKKGGTWWRELKGYVQVINIQGSQWSKTFYLNLGVYICKLGNERNPSESNCHIRNRLEALVSDKEKILALLNYEDYEANSLNRDELCSLLEKHGIPWLQKCSTLGGIREEYKLPGRVLTEHQRNEIEKLFA